MGLFGMQSTFRKGQPVSGFTKHLETHPDVVGLLIHQVTAEDEGHSQLLKKSNVPPYLWLVSLEGDSPMN